MNSPQNIGFSKSNLPEPVSLSDVGVTAYGIVLVCNPDNQNDVEGCGGVLKELRHDGLHS